MATGTATIASLLVLIPFIAGQWSLREPDEIHPLVRFVLIPFIAGQWSLLAPQKKQKE